MSKQLTIREKKEEIQKQKEHIAQKYYDGVCAVCKKKKKVMQFHHLNYSDGELTHRDFNNNEDYQLYILPIIAQRPEDFEYVCRSDHWKITRATKSPYTRKCLERLVKVVRVTG